MHIGTTITQFIIEEQRQIKGATGDFTSLLNDIVTACKVISNAVNKGALIGVMGSLDSENVQGETQKKLDVITNEIFIQSNEWAGHLAGHGLRGDGRRLPDPRPVPARQVPAGVRSAGRLVQRRRQHLRRHHFLHPALPRRRRCATAEAFLQPGTKQVAPVMRCTVPPPCWC